MELRYDVTINIKQLDEDVKFWEELTDSEKVGCLKGFEESFQEFIEGNIDSLYDVDVEVEASIISDIKGVEK